MESLPDDMLFDKTIAKDDFDSSSLSKKSRSISKADPNQSGKSRRNKKGNSYISKIKKLITAPPTQNPVALPVPKTIDDMEDYERRCYDDEKYNDDGGPNEGPGQKLERNRESARNSRKRKKVYINLLEKKVAELLEENEKLRKKAEDHATASKSVGQWKAVNTMISDRNNLFQKLEKVVRLGNTSDPSDVDLLLDSLRFRFGAAGQERITVINAMFKQIVDLLLPLHMKYILWVASEGKAAMESTTNPYDTMTANIFQTIETEIPKIEHNQWKSEDKWGKLVEELHLTRDQQHLMAKFRRNLWLQKQRLEGLISNLSTVRNEILRETNSLQTYVDEMRKILTPIQVAKTLLVLERERNSKELSPERLWAQQQHGSEGMAGINATSGVDRTSSINHYHFPPPAQQANSFMSFLEFKDYEGINHDQGHDSAYDYTRRMSPRNQFP